MKLEFVLKFTPMLSQATLLVLSGFENSFFHLLFLLYLLSYLGLPIQYIEDA